MDIVQYIKSKLSNNNGTLIKIIKTNENLLNALIEKTSFLDVTSTIIQRVYHIKNDIYDIIKCKECGNPVKFKNTKYLVFCDKKCAALFNNKNIDLKLKKAKLISLNYSSKTEEEKQNIKLKRKSTNKLRYNVEHNFDIDRNKIKQTFIKKYGTNTPSKNLEVKNKAKKTCLEKYGTISPSLNKVVKEKGKMSSIKKYGVEFYSQTNNYKKQFKETCLKKYGVEHYMKLDEYLNKCYSYKLFQMPSGKLIKVQGYEDFIINNLLLNGIKEDDIVTNTNEINRVTGRIEYNDNNIIRRYYPDIYIKSKNLLIEVKSDYTYNKQKRKTHLKLNAAKEKGFNIELKIINKKEYDKFKNKISLSE